MANLNRFVALRRGGEMQLPVFYYGSVFQQLPAHGQIVCRAEIIQVGKGIFPFAGYAGAHRAINCLHFICAGVRRAAWIDQSVHTEVAVMNKFAVISAIGIAIFCPLRVQNGMIRPLPNAAAHQPVAGEHGIPIFREAARANPHGVRIFTHKERLFAQLLFLTAFAYFTHMVDMRIHFGDHIVCKASGADHAFVMHRNLRADVMQVFAAGILILPASRLVAQ